MRKEWLWIIVFSVGIALLIPWTLLKWDTNLDSGDDFQIRVKHVDGSVETMSLEEYLVGVVAAEMPAEFELEALKSQAVAARTYAARRLAHPLAPDPGFDVDTTVKTQAWMSMEEMKERWGILGYYRYHAKVKKAVKETQGLVLVANGDYAETYYHSSSGRKPTEKPEEVWSSSRPYLQNVESGEKDPNRFVKTAMFTPQTIYPRLGIEGAPKGFAQQDFQVVSRTTTGRVKMVRFLGKTFTGNQLRTLLGLASTDMEWSVTPTQVTFKTYGYGHAVGMSQYGANDLAQEDYSFEQILEHFYKGTKLLSLHKATS